MFGWRWRQITFRFFLQFSDFTRITACTLCTVQLGQLRITILLCWNLRNISFILQVTVVKKVCQQTWRVSTIFLKKAKQKMDSKVSQLAEFTFNNVCFHLTSHDLGNKKSLFFCFGSHFWSWCTELKSYRKDTSVSSRVIENTADHIVRPPWHDASEVFFVVVCKVRG